MISSSIMTPSGHLVKFTHRCLIRMAERTQRRTTSIDRQTYSLPRRSCRAHMRACKRSCCDPSAISPAPCKDLRLPIASIWFQRSSRLNAASSMSAFTGRHDACLNPATSHPSRMLNNRIHIGICHIDTTLIVRQEQRDYQSFSVEPG